MTAEDKSRADIRPRSSLSKPVGKIGFKASSGSFPPQWGADAQTTRYAREIQLLLNVIEPDPEYQPQFLSDEASLLDCLGTDESIIVKRLSEYFGTAFTHSIRQPVWKLVEELKRTHVGWPE